MKTKLLFFLGILALLVAACRERQPDEGDASISVETAKVDTATYSQPIVSSGIITSDVESRLSFKIGGIIRSLRVKEGDKVYKGQLLAQLDPTEVNAQRQTAKDVLDKSERDFRRITNLYRDSTATTEEYENSRTALSSAKHAYTIANFNEDYAMIHANESGTVINKLANEGENIAPGNPVYVISSTNAQDWVIRIGVSDKEWARLRIGDQAILTTDAYPGQYFDAVVTTISDGSDPMNGTFLVKLKIRPRRNKLANGLSAKIRITPSVKELTKFIPVDALVEADQNSASVFSINHDGRHVTKHEVKIKFTEQSRVAISAGLDNVDRVVTDGSAYLTPSSTVKLKDNSH